MGWSYDSSRLDEPLNQVRFLIGDTVQDDPLIEEDDEITFCLSQKNGNIYLAGAFACRRGAARIARELSLVGKTGLVLQTDTVYTLLTKKAAELETEARSQGASSVFSGGISKSDVETRDQDSNRVPPAFEVDTHMRPLPLTTTGEFEEFFETRG